LPGAPSVTVVERLHELPVGALDHLVAESEQAGSAFVRRLVDEWRSGANRFDRPGEALFAARVEGRLVGVCGLNVDPHAADARVGRVRHLYVLRSFRRQGVGRRLVTEVVEAARGLFDRLHLRTANSEAARLYEALGFHRSRDASHFTHLMVLAPAPATNPP
jgi:GNAT superfamily N-acetyltransferase